MIRADFHFHSKYSRATSQRNEIKTLSQWAKYKGIELLGTADFTHPKWFIEIRDKLNPWKTDNHGTVYEYNNVKYVLTVEVSTIYNKLGKTRKIHHVIIAPDFDTAGQVNDVLGKSNDLSVDGRPVLSMSSAELVEKISEISDNIEIIPAHIWTPWFGVFGSKSGFDSLEDAYEDQVEKIHALETGLSSDPAMNWRLSTLDKYTLVSFSDAHSPENLGREMTLFYINEDELNFKTIIEHIRKKKVGTVEFYPEEGKYHWDGHRKCNVSLPPYESKKYNNLCPVCHKRLTLGVLHRIDDLADRPVGYVPEDAQKTEHLIPLREIVAQVLGVNKISQKVVKEYFNIIKAYGNEWNALHTQDINMINPVIGKAILNMQKGKVKIKPGYDGVYGEVEVILNNEKDKTIKYSHPQKTLFEFE